MLSVKLVVVGGEAKSKEVQLNLPTVIGRGRGKDGVTLTLPHKLVSRKHTELYEQDGQLFVKDLGSLNGTYVNSKRIVQRTPLQPNELLTLGDVTFRAVYDVLTDQVAPEAPKFQEVESDEVLDAEEAKTDSGTNKSLVDINPADICGEEADAVLAGQSTKEQPAAKEKPEEHDAGSISAAGSSDIFSGPTIDGATPEKSICIGALDSLPVADRNADFEVQLDGVERPESIKQVEIELDAPAVAESSDNSRLGSFLKKLPR